MSRAADIIEQIAREQVAESETKPCPACPDGNQWDSNGPTGKACPVCNGYAIVQLNGSPINARAIL